MAMRWRAPPWERASALHLLLLLILSGLNDSGSTEWEPGYQISRHIGVDFYFPTSNRIGTCEPYDGIIHVTLLHFCRD